MHWALFINNCIINLLITILEDNFSIKCIFKFVIHITLYNSVYFLKHLIILMDHDKNSFKSNDIFFSF